MLRLLDVLPAEKRQPNLLFAAVRSLGGPLGPSEFLAWTLDRRNDVAGIMSTRRTQTNEAGRLAVLMPLLAAFTQPVSLLEVGAAAGLCLYPDKWGYRYGDLHVGAGDAPLLVKGDLVGQLGDLVAQAPSYATVVVYHSAVLAYVEEATRDAFVDLVSALPGHWISNEAPAVLPIVAETLPAGATVPDGKFLTAIDGVAVGWAGPHGQDVRWF